MSLSRSKVLALFCVALTVSGLVMSSCGGGGGGVAGGNSTAVNISGRVTLPPGSSLKLAGLSVETSAGTFPVAADGTFKARETGSGVWQLILMDANNNILMLGYADTSNPNGAAISSNTTSEALLFFALGAFTLPSEDYSKALTLINANPALSTLEMTVAARLAADPQALNDSDGQLVAAIQTAHDAVNPRSPYRRPAVNITAPAATQVGITVVRKTPTTSSSSNPQVLISPNTVQSGVEVLQNTNGDGIIVRNHFRRHCSFALYETGFTNAGGQETDFPTAVQVGQLQDLPSTQSLTLFNSLDDVVNGTAPFSPVDSAPVSVGLDSAPGTVKTFYDLVVFGPTDIFTAPDPPIFSDPKFASLASSMHSEIHRLVLLNLIESFLIPIMENIGIVQGTMLATDAPERFLGAINANTLSNALADATSIQQDIKIMLGASGFGGPLRPQAVLGLRAMISAKLDALDAQDAELMAQQAPATLQAMASAGTILRAIDIAMAAFDLGAVLKDLASSQTAEVWNLTASLPTVHLSPLKSEVTDADTQVEFTATVPTPPPGLNFEWSCGNLGVMDDLNGHRGTDIKTTDNVVVYDRTVFPVHTGSDDTVTVTAFDQHGTQIGQQQAAVDGVDVSHVTITPTVVIPTVAQPSETFTATTDQAAPVIYRWTLESSPNLLVGSLTDQHGGSSSSQLITTDAQVTYSVVADDNLTTHYFIDDSQQMQLDVFLDPGNHQIPNGAKPVASATAQATLDSDITPFSGTFTNLDASGGAMKLSAGDSATSGATFSVTVVVQPNMGLTGATCECSFADPNNVIVDGQKQTGSVSSTREDVTPNIAMLGAQGTATGVGAHTFVFHILPGLLTDFVHEDTFIHQIVGPWVQCDSLPFGSAGSISQELEIIKDPTLPRAR